MVMMVSNFRDDVADFVFAELGIPLCLTLPVDDVIEVVTELRESFVTLLFMNDMSDQLFERNVNLVDELLGELTSGKFDHLEFR